MTPTDIGNLSYPELEDLLEGMSKNSERERAEIEGASNKTGDTNDLINFIGNNGGSF